MPTIEIQKRKAAFRLNSYNPETRRFIAVAATETAVRMGGVDECLVCREDAVDLGRMPVPLLRDHRRTLDDQLGTVLRAWFEAGEMLVEVQLTERAAASYGRDLEAGHTFGVSVGYSISLHSESGPRARRVTRWALHEVSLTPVGADPRTKTRSSPQPKPGVSQMENDTDTLETPANENTMATRNAAFRSLGTQTGMTREFVDTWTDKPEADMVAFRAAVNAEMVRQSQATPALQTRVGVSNEDPAVRLQRKVEARAAREMGIPVPDAARPYAYMTLLDHAKEDCRRAGISTLGLSPDDIFARAATHGTSDYVEVSTGTGRRVAQAAYQAAGAQVKQVCKPSSFADFRAKKLLRMSGAGLLEEVSEHGEITGTTRSESVESYTPTTFARMWGISRKALIGDDLGMLTDQARVFGVSAAQTEAAKIVEKLESNPQLSDNVALFDAGRSNYQAGGTPIGVDAIHAARLAMRKLTDADGTLISVGPKFLLVSAELETAAQQFVAAYQPAHFSETQPFSNLTVLVEPRLAPFSWYLFADPTLAPVIEYAHMAGAAGVIVENRAAWTTLGLETRAYLDFGVGAVGWKGAYKFESGEDSNSEV